MLAWSGLEELKLVHEQALAKVKVLATVTAKGLQQEIGRDLAALRQAARESAGQQDGAAACSRLAADFSGLGPALVNLTVRDVRGDLICDVASPVVSMQQSLQTSFAEPGRAGHQQGFSVVGRSSWHPNGRSNGRWLTWLNQALFDDGGKRLGSLNLQLDLVRLSEGLRASVPSNAVVEVLSRQQTIVARSVDEAAFIGRVHAAADLVRGLHEGQFSSISERDDGRFVNYFVTIPGTDWRLLVGLPEAEVFADYDRLLQRSLGLGLAFLLLITWLSWRIGISLLWLTIGATRPALPSAR
ncbi:hypothetical protein [Roseateles oligotrophus]|uniref:Uncharacterized protein n=1 Tax=Roseateles oligotrophus TaxID=1769250 RepID=A0ABT2YFX2_9BURK|nr:hypothetical protein [Roseateles oligotrophus]MCV2368908.1 hypothetical protein [Roseateles oligotrophus]